MGVLRAAWMAVLASVPHWTPAAWLSQPAARPGNQFAARSSVPLAGCRLTLPPCPFFPIPQMTQVNQATRPMRRLYVGGIPQPCYDFMLTTFLNQVGSGGEAVRTA